jgi:hypothetical protein
MAVTPATIAVALGVAAPEEDSPEYQQWALWIADAYMLIAARVASLDVDEPDEAKVDYVVREAVVAHIKHPDDATQVTISVDDGSSSRSYRSGKGRVTILDEWWILLGLTDNSGAFAVEMVPAVTTHLPWCAYSLGANYCSCGADIAEYPIYELGDDY